MSSKFKDCMVAAYLDLQTSEQFGLITSDKSLKEKKKIQMDHV